MAATETNSSVDWDALIAHPDVASLCALALREDLGPGDVTTESIFVAPQVVRAQIIARRPTVACGVPLLQHLLLQAASEAAFTNDTVPNAALPNEDSPGGIVFDKRAPEGSAVEAGGVVLEIRADVRLLLVMERTLLNFAMRLCGIAMGTRQAVQALPAGSKTKILDTRKTIPGWRRLEKAAVRTGGGTNHRMGLFDAVLIKDNHVAAAGSVSEAVQRARARVGRKLTVEVEVDTLEQLEEALAAGPDMILLDNFTVEELRLAVAQVKGRVPLEASGGITVATLPAVAATGVDRISMGSLTHSALPADLGLDLLP